MLRAYVQEAVLSLASHGDARAPGAAITLELCGSWDHEPPCPVAQHHTGAELRGSSLVRLRILFAAEARRETLVRRRIRQALARGTATGPDRVVVRWKLLRTAPGRLAPADLAQGRRLTRTGGNGGRGVPCRG